MERPLFLSMLLAGIAPIPAATHAPAGGTISGTVVTSRKSDSPALLGPVPSTWRIVARTADGTEVGKLYYGTPHADPNVGGVLPFNITRVPLGVEVTISTEAIKAVSPTPIPSGFFMFYNLVALPQDGTVTLKFTLTAAKPRTTALRFAYVSIEAPPMPPLPAATTPAPSPEPSPAPS